MRCWIAWVAWVAFGCGSNADPPMNPDAEPADAAAPRDVAPPDAAPATVEERLRERGATPCRDDERFLCLPLSVPLDHGDPEGKRIEVMFALRPAPPATREGMLVTASGGPGYSGIDELDTWETLDERIPDRFDVVFFDLRGVGRSGGFECWEAAGAYFEGGLRVASDVEETRVVARARALASACPEEIGVPADELRHYRTEQAVEDLEAFRRVVGDEKLILYGLSYGTQFAQTYAARHPDHVVRLAIDGVIDLGLTHVGYMQSVNERANALLDQTLDACADDPGCAAEFAEADGTTARERVRAGYLSIATRLDASPVDVDGVEVDRGTLDATTAEAVGTPDGRRALLAAIAAAFRGDYVPLSTLAYGKALARGTGGSGLSSAVYFTVTCNDYGWDAPSEAEREELFLSGGRAVWGTERRLVSPYYVDLPCAYWPTERAAPAPSTAVLAGVPVLVIGATGDATTPIGQGLAVAERLEDAYAITVEGGSHVMYGRGNRCVDELANDFVVEGARPASRDVHCEDVFVATE